MKPYRMHAGLAVMLFQKYRNVLPIKYIYRRGGLNSFAFEPVQRGTAVDDNFIKSAVYPEIIYNSDRDNAGPRKHKINVGKIPRSWLQQKKKSRVSGQDLIYNRGGHADNAIGGKNWYDKFQYRDYSFQSVSQAKSRSGDRTRLKRDWNEQSSVWGLGPEYVMTKAKTPDDLLTGTGRRSHPLYKEFKSGMNESGGFGRKTSKLQVTPQGLKARWIRGGGPGGGQHLRELKLPRGNNMMKGGIRGDIEEMPSQHIMKHWYRLWQANYELHLQGQAQRVLRSFVRMVYPDEGAAKIEQPKVERGTKTVRRSLSSQRGTGPRGGVTRYSTKREITMATRRLGVGGPLTQDKFMKLLKETDLHHLGSQKTKSEWDPFFTPLQEREQNVKSWIQDVKQLERKLNANTKEARANRKKLPAGRKLIATSIGFATGIVLTSKPKGQPNSKVQFSIFIVPTGRTESLRIAGSLTRKNAARKKVATQATIESSIKKANQTINIITDESLTLMGIIAGSHTSITLEDEDGAAMKVGNVMAEKVFRKVNRELRSQRKYMQQSLGSAFDPADLNIQSGFKDWYAYWLRESQRLERLTVGSNRGAWQKFMREYVAPTPKTNNPKKGRLQDYLSASKTWHPPGHIRPFVRMGRADGENYNQP
tara:strand:+ start:1463 stop:3406 length:1944 start_codon:yes stop_codon:yes gene_type:complete